MRATMYGVARRLVVDGPESLWEDADDWLYGSEADARAAAVQYSAADPVSAFCVMRIETAYDDTCNATDLLEATRIGSDYHNGQSESEGA